MREWRAKEAKAAEGRLRDLKRRLEKRLDWYQRDKPVRKEGEHDRSGLGQ